MGLVDVGLTITLSGTVQAAFTLAGMLFFTLLGIPTIQDMFTEDPAIILLGEMTVTVDGGGTNKRNSVTVELYTKPKLIKYSLTHELK